MLTDTHCHLDFKVFDGEREAILADCRKVGIHNIVVPGVKCADWGNLLDVCRQYHLYPALGMHPYYISEHREQHLSVLQQKLETENVVAIGEIGLDYYLPELDKQQQGYFFEHQLKLAASLKLPVLIHARKSHDSVLKYLKRFTPNGGIVHAFSGSLQQAREFLKLGFKLGFGGAYTYPRAKKLRRLVLELPIEAWVLETDAPDMSPYHHHGQRNSPVYLNEIFQSFTELQQENGEADEQQLMHQLHSNAAAVLKL